MNIATKTTTKTFTQVAEVWVPDGGEYLEGNVIHVLLLQMSCFSQKVPEYGIAPLRSHSSFKVAPFQSPLAPLSEKG